MSDTESHSRRVDDEAPEDLSSDYDERDVDIDTDISTDDAPIEIGNKVRLKSIPRKLKNWLRRNICYLISVASIFIIAVGLGAAPSALDLNNIEKYNPAPTYTNRLQVQLVLDSPPVGDIVNSTAILLEPLHDLDAVTSYLFVNLTNSNSSLVTGEVDIESETNVTAELLLEYYTNSSIVATVELLSSEASDEDKYTSFNAWLTLLIVCFCLALLLKEDAVSPDVALTLALVVLTLAGVITVKEALSGFANEGIATIGALYIVALGVSNSGALELMSRYVLGAPTGITIAILRLMTPLAVLSAFINNTPIVSMMAPVVVSWSQRVNLPPSKLLIPLSYAAILGGTITLIGTSTNLIVQALLADVEPDIDLPLFGIAPVGVPTAILGIIYMVLIGHRILPARETPGQQLEKDPRAYSAHVTVKADAEALVGKTLGNAGLRHLIGLFVYSVERRATGEIFDAPSSQFVLEAGDIIAVAGDVNHVNRLWKIDGLELHAEEDVRRLRLSSGGHRMVEVVIAPHSDLIGRTPRSLKFRSRFNAAIVGLHRRGEHLQVRLGDLELLAGDVLLLVTAGDDFMKLHHRSPAFSLVAEIGAASVRRKVAPARVIFVSILAITMIVLASIDSLDLSLFTLALVVGYLLWLSGFISISEARSSVDIAVITMVASSIGLSSAMQNSGLALRIGTSLIELFSPVGELGLLFGIYIATTLLNAFVSNSASVSLTFPIAYVISQQAEVLNIKMISYVLMLAGSADFSTPIGYQTNLMVYSIGNYRFLDYTKVGMPLQLICCIVGCVVGYYVYQEDDASSASLASSSF